MIGPLLHWIATAWAVLAAWIGDCRRSVLEGWAGSVAFPIGQVGTRRLLPSSGRAISSERSVNGPCTALDRDSLGSANGLDWRLSSQRPRGLGGGDLPAQNGPSWHPSAVIPSSEMRPVPFALFITPALVVTLIGSDRSGGPVFVKPMV